MADRELRRMHRAELIEIIYALKQSEDQLKAQNAALTAQLQDRQLRLESAGSIAQAALELNNVFAAAQAAADDHRFAAQFRVVHLLHSGKKGVHIQVQNHGESGFAPSKAVP